MATPQSALSNVIKEELAPGIRTARIKEDPVWARIQSSSMGVTREGLGRDWKFIQSFVAGGDFGAYEFSTAAVLAGGTLGFEEAGVVGQFGAGNGFPTRTESTNPAFFQKTITLKEARGNMFIPLKWLQIDEFDSSLGSAVKILMDGAARKAARVHAAAFWTTDATSFVLVDNIPSTADAGTYTFTINNASSTAPHGRIQMIHIGQVVDIYNSLHSKLNAGSGFVVTAVDYLNNKFTIKELVAGDTDPDTNSANVPMYLVLRNSRGNQTSGIHSWMKTATGTIFGIDIAVHPEFGSQIITETGPATEKMLDKYVGTFFDRIGTMCSLDTIVSSAGVVHAYRENEDNLSTYERNGRRLEIKAGMAEIDYSYNGHPFEWLISTYCGAGRIYGLKLGGGNIKEYVPPQVKGGGKNSTFGNEIVFLGPLGGSTSIFLNELAATTAAPTDQFQAPYYRQCEVAPEQVQGIIISGLDEVYAN